MPPPCTAIFRHARNRAAEDSIIPTKAAGCRSGEWTAKRTIGGHSTSIPPSSILWSSRECRTRPVRKRCNVWRLRRFAGWIFAVECFLFATLVWIIHYPPHYGQPFIRGGDASSLPTIIQVCAFYFAVISILGIAWWTTWKGRASSRIWGLAASIASLFVYMDPSRWYQIHQPGVWVHWAICLLGLIAFIAPQSERRTADATSERLDNELPNAGICYSWGIVFPVVYLLTRRRNRQNAFLRFHCIQCLILFSLGALCVLSHKGRLLDVSDVALLVVVLSYFVALFKAAQHKQFRLPLISALAERLT